MLSGKFLSLEFFCLNFKALEIPEKSVCCLKVLEITSGGIIGYWYIGMQIVFKI